MDRDRVRNTEWDKDRKGDWDRDGDQGMEQGQGLVNGQERDTDTGTDSDPLNEQNASNFRSNFAEYQTPLNKFLQDI